MGRPKKVKEEPVVQKNTVSEQIEKAPNFVKNTIDSFIKDKDRTTRIDPNALSLTRSTAFFVSMWLTAAFVITSFRGMVTDWMFVTYPAGVCLCFAPALFSKVAEKIRPTGGFG